MNNQDLVIGQESPVELALIAEWAKKAGKLALSKTTNLERSYKNGSIVTSADMCIENYLIKQIQSHFPSHSILSEETGYVPGNDRFLWVMDPIDGTRAYASGLPIWGISIGLIIEGKPVTGVYFMPAVSEMYLGGEGKAYLNGIQMPHVLGRITEEPSTFLAVPSSAFRDYEISFPRVRSLGSTVAHLAYATRGIAVGVLTRRLYIWDIAGIYPLLQATGIDLRYLNGDSFHLSELIGGKPAKGPLFASHPRLRKSLCSMIRSKNTIGRPASG